MEDPPSFSAGSQGREEKREHDGNILNGYENIDRHVFLTLER